MRIDPLAPEEVVPVEKTSSPLTPLTPAFKVRMITLPEDDSVPNPLIIEMEPPVAPVELAPFDFPAYM